MLVQTESFSQWFLHILANPFMTHDIKQRNSHAVTFQQSWDEVSCPRRYELWIANFDASDSVVGFFGILCFEGRTANQKFVAQDAETPLIDWIIVMFSFNHFWRQIIQSSTHCLSVVGYCVSGPSKVSKFYIIVSSQKNVFWLEIAMNDIVQVTVMQSVGNLISVFGRTILLKSSIFCGFQVTVELTFACKFQRNVNLTIVMEPSEQA